MSVRFNLLGPGEDVFDGAGFGDGEEVSNEIADPACGPENAEFKVVIGTGGPDNEPMSSSSE